MAIFWRRLGRVSASFLCTDPWDLRVTKKISLVTNKNSCTKRKFSYLCCTNLL